MFTFFLVLHFIFAILMILMIVFQKKDSDGGAIGFGGGSSGGAFTPRGEANILTKGTYILACLFFLNCLIIAKLVDHSVDEKGSLLNAVAENTYIGTEQDSKVPDAKGETLPIEKTVPPIAPEVPVSGSVASDK